MGLWLFLGQRQGMAAVHTACGRSESKHLRPTPAGHEESCPVIALCWLGSPRQARRGPVSCDSGHSGLATQPRGIKYRDAPSPHPTPLLLLPVSQHHRPTRVRLCLWCGLSTSWVLSLGVGWKWGEPPATSSGRKSGGGQGEEPTPEKPQQEREAEGPNHDGVALKTGQSVQTVEGCDKHRDHEQ
ncbi:leukemia inhibitory factor isoform X4 [Cricetulus griseus]|uniref:Leukemia inhibitory factor isoform X4 n=1 Tax=Cricetulus griseus TaxID=10029 RepID=A0A9J7HAU1_CRIGR|nr:leukemia inhibitory factor isoform X4 [Cricetulus griseus]